MIEHKIKTRELKSCCKHCPLRKDPKYKCDTAECRKIKNINSKSYDSI